jgi:hypothetical protein
MSIITQVIKRIKRLFAGQPAPRPQFATVPSREGRVKNTPWRGRAAKPQETTRSILWTAGNHTRVLQVAL